MPLLAALPDVQFTVVTNRVKKSPEDALPSNVSIVTVPGRLGPYYYGIADRRFASFVLHQYPVHHEFWRQFDVIHLNQTLGARFSELTKGPAAVLHAIHHPVSADRAIAMEESQGFQKFLWWLRYFLPVRAQRALCQRIFHSMTVSQTVADRLVRDYGCKPEQIHVVPNGVDGEEFSPSSEKSFDVIAVGSLVHPRKGFRYLVDVYRELAAHGLKIADVGRRSEEQMKVLQTISSVTAFGSVPHAKLVELMRTSSVLVSTSLYEGFGLSLIEALSCGHPAFAFAGGAVAEVLGSIDPTLVIPLRDSKKLVEHVRAFLSLLEEDRHNKGERYRRDVLQHFSIAHAAEQLRFTYDRVQGKIHCDPRQ